MHAKARRTLAHASGLHLSARHDSPPRPPKYTGQCPHVLSSPASHLPPTSPRPAPSLAIARIIVAGNLRLTAGSDTNTSYVRGIGGLEGHSMWILAPAFSPSTLPLPPARPHPLNTLGAARSFILLARSVRMITSITAEERAGQNACSVYDRSRVQDGVGPIDPRDSSLFRANDRLPKSRPELQIRLTQLARESLRRQAWPTSGEVVTGFQSDSSRTDSPVRVLHAQPGSRSPRALLKVASAEGPPLFDSRVFQRRES